MHLPDPRVDEIVIILRNKAMIGRSEGCIHLYITQESHRRHLYEETSPAQ